MTPLCRSGTAACFELTPAFVGVVLGVRQVYVVFVLMHLLMLAFFAFWAGENNGEELDRLVGLQRPHAVAGPPAHAAAAAPRNAGVPVAVIAAPPLLVEEFDSALLPPAPDLFVIRLACGVSCGRVTSFVLGLILPSRWSIVAAPLACLSYGALFALGSLLAWMRWSLIHDSMVPRAAAIVGGGAGGVGRAFVGGGLDVLRFFPRITQPLPRRWVQFNSGATASLLLCFLLMSGSDLAVQRINEALLPPPLPLLAPLSTPTAMATMAPEHFTESWYLHPAPSPSKAARMVALRQCPSFAPVPGCGVACLFHSDKPQQPQFPQCAADDLPLVSSSSVLGLPPSEQRPIVEGGSDDDEPPSLPHVASILHTPGAPFSASPLFPSSSSSPSSSLSTAPVVPDAAPHVGLIARRVAPFVLWYLDSLRSLASWLGSVQISLAMLLMGLVHVLLGCQLEGAAGNGGGGIGGIGGIGGSGRSVLLLRHHRLLVHLPNVFFSSTVICISSLSMCGLNLLSLLLPTAFFAHFRTCQSAFLASELVLILALVCATRVRVERAELPAPPIEFAEVRVAPAA